MGITKLIRFSGGMKMKAPTFTIDHIGINTVDEQAAYDTARQLCQLWV